MYSWSPAAGLSDPAVSNPFASPLTTTTYTVTVSDPSTGFSGTDSVKITVLELPAANAGADISICQGNSTTLGASGGIIYAWTPTTSLSDPSIFNPVASPATTTTYTVTVTDASGCASSDSVKVTVNAFPLPTINAGTSLAICAGESANLSVTGANTYLWSPGTSLNDPASQTPIASPSGTTLYTVRGTDQNGCYGEDTITVVVHDAPPAYAGRDTSICIGDSIRLNASGGFIYKWTPAAGLSSTTVSNPLASPAAITTYTVVVTSLNFCKASDEVTIAVNLLPSAAAGSDVMICYGDSAQLSASGGAAYLWRPGYSLTDSTIADPFAKPADTTQYIVTVYNAAGCSDNDTVIVGVYKPLNITPASVIDETCTSSNGSITAGSITAGAAPYTYSLNGAAGQSSPVFNGLNQGNYSLMITDQNGCSITQQASVGQIINTNASFSANPSSGSKPLLVNFTNTSTGATSYFWDFGNDSTSTAVNPSTVYFQNGSYNVMLIASNGGAPCVDTFLFTINVIQEIITAVPNVFTPNGDGINDVFLIISEGIVSVSGEIYNRWGQKIYSWSGDEKSGWDGKINGASAPDGTYYYVLKERDVIGQEHEQKGYVQLFGK